jgi:hypothetical protein
LPIALYRPIAAVIDLPTKSEVPRYSAPFAITHDAINRLASPTTRKNNPGEHPEKELRALTIPNNSFAR